MPAPTGPGKQTSIVSQESDSRPLKRFPFMPLEAMALSRVRVSASTPPQKKKKKHGPVCKEPLSQLRPEILIGSRAERVLAPHIEKGSTPTIAWTLLRSRLPDCAAAAMYKKQLVQTVRDGGGTDKTERKTGPGITATGELHIDHLFLWRAGGGSRRVA